MITCPDGKTFKRYKDYLLSVYWKNKKNEYFSTYEKKCSKCGSISNIELHHLTYKNIGHEHLCDLTPLCEKCHKEYHSNNSKKPVKKKKSSSKNKDSALVKCSECKHLRYESYCIKMKATAKNYYKPKVCGKFSKL